VEPLKAVFFETEQGNQPVRDFILGLSREARKEIGADIFKVQATFPRGFPLVEKKLTPAYGKYEAIFQKG